MKTALILVLFVLLLLGAFISRPSQADFKRYITDQTTANDHNFLTVGWDQLQADQFVQRCTFKDRLLWTDVQKDGKTIYTGAFGHWFNHTKIANGVKAVEKKVDTTQT